MATGERVGRKEGGDAGDVVASSAGGADAAQGAAEGGDERDFVAFERQGKGGSSKRRKAKLNDSSARLGRGAVKKVRWGATSTVASGVFYGAAPRKALPGARKARMPERIRLSI